SSYLDRLERGLGAKGGDAEILIVQSNGGIMTLETAKKLPARTALSGPAAGVIAAGHIARAAGFPNVITCDMGGTSFDVSLISEGESALSAQTQIDFGMVIRTPMIEITTIGAGGGSIARVDRGGLLDVGPDSAGSDPGPVCYGFGNDRPTVTDANLVLGRINPARPIGGKLKRLDVEAAQTAIARAIGDPLDLDVIEAAEAVIRVANARMAGAIRLVSIERGHDPKDFAVMPFGGGGALHAGALMSEIGLAAAIVPRYPGVTSALGCVTADMRHDVVQTVNLLLDDLDAAALGADMVRIATDAEAVLVQGRARFDRVEHLYELDMLYVGQTHTVAVPVEVMNGGLTSDEIRIAFETAYKSAYGRLLESIPARVINLRVAAVGRRPKFDLTCLAPDDPTKSPDACTTGSRRVWSQGDWHDAAVYERLDLPCGAEIAGPALLEQPDTTIYIDPGLAGRVDAYGNLIIVRATERT
ncbi:MAG: hydantoinase/oxoprolinase family protein, partial [Hyphomicrobiales bacterium]